ncbi:hypothetical protein QOY93_06260 [Leclercia adecarboxylata]|uniref:hypothetical protein n=1 Tax=Leclercia adecarboxylata TaxID=83655 RepID=UPI002551B3B3|nr:hypothetical protein [Leclercia adecarboxylata]MDK4744974.1 hypothetical protein [Leclercia adecarboxylata]
MRALLILLAGLFVLLLTRPALADMSCYINEDAAGAYAVGNSPLMVLDPGKVTTPTRLNATYTFVIPFRGVIRWGVKRLSPGITRCISLPTPAPAWTPATPRLKAMP